jgi:3,4-dihydroxy 2-butanone 4-phosphate synthase/GTP cyclohydrolase II
MLARVEEAIDAIRRGEMVILVDDEDRENEGDLVIAAEKVTPEAINFMAVHGRGLICLSMTDERLRQLNIPMMVDDNTSPYGTAFTVSIEAAEGVTTGISAADRARTVQVAVAPDAGPRDLVRPGHVFPLRARPGGVLARTGQTEGSVDLAFLAGLEPAAVICEILNDDGTMARLPQLEEFADKHDLHIVSVADLIKHRLSQEGLVERLSETPFPNAYGKDFKLRCYRDQVDGSEHLVLVLGEPEKAEEPVPVRVQHQCVIGDVFRGLDCGCGWQLHGSMEYIAEHGCGVLVYLHKKEHSRFHAVQKYVMHEKRDVTDSMTEEEKVQYVNQPKPEFRTFGVGAQILADCGVQRMKVLNNFNVELVGLEAYGLQVEAMIPIPKPEYMRKAEAEEA